MAPTVRSSRHTFVLRSPKLTLSCADFPYPGRTDLHCMVVPLFHRAIGTIDSQLAFSRDGLMWHRPERRACYEVGPEGSGTEGMVHCWRAGLVEMPDGGWAVPHWVSANLHGGSDDELYANPLPPTQTRLAIWQPHRLCGVEASGTEGRFTIPSIFRKSEQLRLNYRCEAGVRAPSIPNQSWGGADL